MSVSLKIDGLDVDIKSASVKLEKPSGLLDFDSVAPTISSQIALGNTPRNFALFKNLHRPSSTANFDINSATLEYRKLQVSAGEFVLNSANRIGM